MDKAARCDIALRQELLFEMKEQRRARREEIEPCEVEDSHAFEFVDA